MRLVSITGKRQCVAAEIHPGSERKPDQMLADRSKMTAAYVGWSLGALGFYYAWFQRVIPSVMVDRLMADFAVGGAVLGTLSSLYFYAYAVTQLPVGAMVDRWGPALPYAGALILAALGSSLFAVAESIEMAYAGRILIGVGSAFGWVAALKIIAERFPPDRFAMMSGAGMFIGLCGGFSGQVIVGSLVDAFGWRITMWGAAIAGLLLSVAIYAIIGTRPAESAVDAPTMREILSGFGTWRTVAGGGIGFWRCCAFLRNGGGLVDCGNPGFRICICQYADDTFRCYISTGRRLVARSELVWIHIKRGAHIRCGGIRNHFPHGACHLSYRPRYDLALPVR